MTLRYFANAPATTLSASVSAAATLINVNSVSGYPITFPWTGIIGRGTATEEVVTVTNVSGTTLTVVRGADGTTAFSHSTGEVFEHGISAQDPREANAHVNASAGVHGLTGSVVGTTDAQTLTNKTISVDNNTVSGIAASSFVLSNASGNVDGAAAQKAIPTGTVVGTSDTQTLTNKTLGTTNTINGFTASRFMEADGTGRLVSGTKAIPSGAVVGTTDTQALTNKTLTGATIDSTSTLGGGTQIGAWTTYTPTWTNSTTNPTLGDGTLTGAYIQIGKLVHYRIQLTIGSTTTFGTGSFFSFGLPVAPLMSQPRVPGGTATVFDASPSTVFMRHADIEALAVPANNIILRAEAGTLVSATSPITFAVGDQICITGSYEAA